MTVQVPLREKYLHHTAKKVSKKSGGNTGSSKEKRFKLPNAVPGALPPARIRVLVLIDGRRSWSWK